MYRKYQLAVMGLQSTYNDTDMQYRDSIIRAIIVDWKGNEVRREIRRRSRENDIAKKGEKGRVHYALRWRHKRGDRSSVKDM